MARKRVPKKIRAIVQKYSERLAEQDRFPIDRVILFGSYAKGHMRKGSDIDVCIVSPRFKDPFAAITLLLGKRNNKEVLAGIEPVGFTLKDFNEGGTFINEIKRTGVTIR
ncbi:nucleotidyltransferase domain-containing protein [Candidatus Uhrbacteria bacterium]|nr:nucleotidyltransferase domain-containing protein [Candidatus Uhrbacteria bacterium]